IVKEELVYPDMPQANWTRQWSDFDNNTSGGGLPYGMIYLTGRNNPGREKTTSSMESTSYDWKWRYTYNDDGYVTSATSYDYQTDDKVNSYVYKLIPAK